MEILIVEDSRFLRTAIERALTKAGHRTTGLSDGREGLLAARKTCPDLILLDMMLPGLDGTTVLKELKKDATTARIPVIVLTGLAQRNEVKMIKGGAAVFIEKAALGVDKSTDTLIQIVNGVLASSYGGSGKGEPTPENVETIQQARSAGRTL